MFLIILKRCKPNWEGRNDDSEHENMHILPSICWCSSSDYAIELVNKQIFLSNLFSYYLVYFVCICKECSDAWVEKQHWF